MVALVAGQASGDPDTEPYVRHYIDRLERLAQELAKHGLVTRLLTPTGRVPSLHVVIPADGRPLGQARPASARSAAGAAARMAGDRGTPASCRSSAPPGRRSHV